MSTLPNGNKLPTHPKLEDAVFDAAKMAEVTLDEVLEEESPEDIIKHELSHTSVENELKAKQILKHDTGRAKSRVLFVTRNQAYLEEGSREMRTLLAGAPLFDEVHVLVLCSLGAKEVVDRVASNIWVYNTSSQYWWWLPVAAKEAAKEQLSFSDGFRPDIVVGLDPFESGLAALLIARKYSRPHQIHIEEDFLHPAFKNTHGGGSLRMKMARYVLKRTPSVRTTTAALKDKISQHFPRIADLRVLPQFHNFTALIEAQPTFNLHDKYKDFIFIMLAFGNLTTDSNLHDTFSALNQILHNPRIGLLVIGDGPAKKLFQEKVKILGIERNVIFMPKVDDLVSFLKTADVLIETSTSKESDEVVIQAAAAGLPLIMYATQLRKDLFEDGESASICEPGDVYTLGQNVTTFLNNQALRVQYKDAAQYVVRTRLAEDESTHYRAFRDSIEIAMDQSQD